MLHLTISTSAADPSKAKLDALLVVTPTFSEKSASWKKLGQTLTRLHSQADPRSNFKGEEGSAFLFPTLGQIAPGILAFAGTGESKDIAVHRRCIGKAIRQLHERNVRSLGIIFTSGVLPTDVLLPTIEEATYRFRTFSSNSKESPADLSRVILFMKSISKEETKQARSLAEAIRYARDLANQPPNLFNPGTLAAEAQKLARRRKLKCQIWDFNRLKKEGFGGVLAVGQGSANTPRFVRLDHRGGRPSEAPYVIVGKAITFDTGGISLKPSGEMDEMKFDKCGGIAVLGIMDAVAALKLPINVTGLISSAENMPSSTAYRPGDLVRSLSGKYIEVLNTDAEGRIVLADALTYAQRLKPRAMVDLATLTGACVVCFGHECAGLLGNKTSLQDDLRAASEKTGEKIWPLPLWPEYQEKVKSDIGFVKNTAGRPGGTITAACFLNAFVDPKIPWAHLDIAGVAWTSKAEGHREKGASAFGVRLITEWLKSEC